LHYKRGEEINFAEHPQASGHGSTRQSPAISGI